MFNTRKMTMVEAEKALRGRVAKLPVADRHAVHGTPLDGPFPGMELALFGMGCFWGAEKGFWLLPGVHSTSVGYAGGFTPNATYEEVCSGLTGHAEVVQLTFNPQVISFKEILQVFFTIHDPTTLNRQGNDVGTQYRSAIFTHSEAQRRIAEQAIKEITEAKIWDGKIVTEVTPLSVFYPAEDYHQEYFLNNPFQPYCQYVVVPKVVKFRKMFLDKVKR